MMQHLEVAKRRSESYLSFINQHIDHLYVHSNLAPIELPSKLIHKQEGKVRDIYVCEKEIVLVTTDRLSAFDRHITSIPFKGALLNLISNWWFAQTAHIVPNHLLQTINPHTNICKRCEVFPIEFVMRGYLTGSTSTSIWKHYESGARNYCGHTLPDGMAKHQKLPQNLLTPTTKSNVHDELISKEEIITHEIMRQEDFEICEHYAHTLFSFGQQIASEKGFILVDTKYEFGKDEAGKIILVDELHSPDSSRYWMLDSYEDCQLQGTVITFVLFS